MRILLILALLLYNIIALATRPNYDYEDDINKRLISERRNSRQKALLKSDDHKDWDTRRRFEYDRFLDDSDVKSHTGVDRIREAESYRQHYEDSDKWNNGATKSMEMTHAAIFPEKDQEKKYPFVMNCERPHERYEACFAGCASVTCDNPRDRLRPCYPFCEPGCICVHPYVRDDRTHKCVLPEDCTKGLKGIPDLGDDR